MKTAPDLDEETASFLAYDQAAQYPIMERIMGYFEQSPIGLAILDDERRIVMANASFREMVHAPLKEGTSFFSLLHPDSRIRARNLIEHATKSEQGMEIGFHTNPDLIAELYTCGSQSTDVRTIHLINVTESRQLELQFAQSQKMQAIGQLAGGIAHDFSNLLTAINGFCDLLLLRIEAHDASFPDIMQIKQNTARAANLVRQLLAFSRRQTLHSVIFAPHETIQDLFNLLRRLLGDAYQLNIVNRKMGLVKLDQNQFEQVIVNLVINARNAMPKGGAVNIEINTVSVDKNKTHLPDSLPDGEYVCIRIEDHGVGIAPEHLGKIFEPFFTTQQSSEGVGLGLATVYGIVRQSGGYIFPFSKLGVGTRMEIYFPAYSAQEKMEQTPVLKAVKNEDLTGRGNILLVEDERAVRLFCSRALRSRGYVVRDVDHGEKAIEILKDASQPVDLLISDITMPGVSGITLMKQAREIYPDLPVILVSGYAEDAFRDDRDLSDRSDFLFLAKPFSLKEVAAMAKKALAK